MTPLMWPSWGQALTGSPSPRTCAVRAELPAVRLADAPVAGDMPQGMFLKSQGFASNLSDPAARTRWTPSAGRPGGPTPTTASRSRWTRSSPTASGSRPRTRRMSRRPWSPRSPGRWDSYSSGPGRRAAPPGPARSSWRRASSTSRTSRTCCPACPPRSARTASAHTDLSSFRGQPVVVVGAGQSALEIARPAARERGRRSRSWRGAAGGLERPAAGPGPATAAAAPRARGRPGLGLEHLVLLASIPASSGTCRRPPASTGPAPRSARPGPAGCAAGSRASSRADQPRPGRAASGPGGGPARLVRSAGWQHGRRSGWPRTMSSRRPATGPTSAA